MRIKPKHCNLWLADRKIKSERMVHQSYLAEKRWYSDLFRYFFKRTVASGNSDTHVFAYHEHKHFISSCLSLQIFSVSAKMKIIRLDIFLVYRCSYKNINFPALKVINCSFERNESSLSSLRCRFSKLYPDIVIKAVNHICFSWICLISASYIIKAEITDVKSFPVVSCYLR